MLKLTFWIIECCAQPRRTILLKKKIKRNFLLEQAN